MTRGQSNPTPASASRPAPGSPEAIGRRAGLAVFYVLVLFVIGAGALSIGKQVFADRASAPAAGKLQEDCASEVSWLRSELLRRGGSHVMEAPASVPIDNWLEPWDQRHAGLVNRCGHLHEVSGDLYELRREIQIMLQRFNHQQAPLVRSINQAVQQAQKPTVSPLQETASGNAR